VETEGKGFRRARKGKGRGGEKRKGGKKGGGKKEGEKRGERREKGSNVRGKKVKPVSQCETYANWDYVLRGSVPRGREVGST